MKKSLTVFITAIILLLIVIQPLMASEYAEILDLREEKESLQPLEGQWEFYWETLLEPEDFRNDPLEPSAYVPVPGAWNGYRVNGEDLSGEGYATYRTHVLVESDRMTAFRIPRILTAYRMWVDGEEVASAGTVGTSRQESTPRYLPQQVFVVPASEVVEIVVQVSNFHHRSGGILENIQAGTEAQVLSATKSRLAYELFLFGSLLVMGIYHLLLYRYRQKDRSLLYFALYCLMIGIRTTLVGEIFLIQVFPNFPWEVAHKMQTLGFYGGVLILVLFFREMYPRHVSVTAVRISALVVGIFGAVVLVTPARVFTVINPAFQIFTILISLYFFVILLRICRHKEPGALFIAFGYGFLIVTVMNDLIYVSILMSDYQFLNRIILRGNLSSFGLLVFALTHSFVLAIQYANTYNRNEEMTRELMDLNENLESLVKERTEDLAVSYRKIEEQKRELEESNRKLEMMAQKDGLTGVRNRRYFDEILAFEWRRAFRMQQSLSLLFLDIDNFKDFNDKYGHQAGDACLKKVAEELKKHAKRSTDTVARYGGEEFVVLLSDSDHEGTGKLAEEIRAGMEALGITVSIGAARMTPAEDVTKEDLIREADQAMYKAKRKGKNRVEFML